MGMAGSNVLVVRLLFLFREDLHRLIPSTVETMSMFFGLDETLFSGNRIGRNCAGYGRSIASYHWRWSEPSPLPRQG